MTQPAVNVFEQTSATSSQVSTVQAKLSAQLRGVLTQLPAALQASLIVQYRPSSQVVPADLLVHVVGEVAGVQI
jgi:hypothetical protein